jgi:hypothetical protein
MPTAEFQSADGLSTRSAGLIASSDNGGSVVRVGSETLSMFDAGPVDLVGVQPCELVQIIMVDELGLSAVCTGSGSLVSLFSDFRSGDQLFRLTRAVLQAVGGRVVVAQGRVVVTMPESRGDDGPVGGFSADAPLGILQATTVDEFEGFVAIVDPDDAGTIARNIGLNGDRFSHRFVDVGQNELRELVSVLGIEGTVLDSSAGASLFVGSAGDAELIRQILNDVPFSVHVLSAPVVSDQFLAALSASGFLTVDFDRERGLLWLSGDTQEVARAVTLANQLQYSVTDRYVEAAFVYASTDDFRSFSAQLGGSITSTDGVNSLVLGSGGDGLSLALDQVRGQTGIVIEERPRIATRDGVQAEFQNGRDVPVQSSVDEDGRSSIEYRQSGTLLRVLTHTLPDGMVVVDVYLEVSSVDGAGVAENPTFSRRSVSTQVVVRPGQVVALSGFTSRQDETANARAFWFLPQISGRDREERLHILLSVT